MKDVKGYKVTSVTGHVAYRLMARRTDAHLVFRIELGSIGELPKLCVKIRILKQGHVLIADLSVAHLVVIMNDVMNDNMAAFAHVGARLGAFFYWTRFLENNVPFDNIPL